MDDLDKEIYNEMLHVRVIREFGKCKDLTVRTDFDIDSTKNLKQKLKVLKKINSGQEVSDEELDSILELKDKGAVEII